MLPLQPHLREGAEVSRYRVEGMLARGGMGLVYRARDTRLDRPVALKVLSPDFSGDARFRERFVRESRLAASVDHPHVIPIYEADDWHGLLYIAMRLVHGADLAAVLDAGYRIDVPTALRVLGQTAAALDAAHDAGLVHRDVKPGNLLMAGATEAAVPADVHVYLTDFGLTKKTSSVSGITATGQFLGTLHYVSPEQIRGGDVDRRADLYALACVAYEVLAGDPPFARDGDAAVLWAQVYAPPPQVTAVRPDLPVAVDTALARGLAKEAGARPETCGEFVALLCDALVRAAAPGTVVPPPVPGPAPGAGPDPRPPHPSLPGSVLPGAGLPGVEPGTVPRRPDEPVPDPWGRPARAERPARRGRRAVLAGAAVLLAVAVALALWRPWSAGPALVERALLPGWAAAVPDDWTSAEVGGRAGFTVHAPRDWTAVFRSDAGRAAAAQAVADDPDTVVGVYAEVAEGLDAASPVALVGLVEPHLAAPVTLTPGESTRLGGRDAVAFTGVLDLGGGEQLLLSGTVTTTEPRLLVVGFSPAAVADDWRPVFADVVGSVTPD
ncbi:protein kinase [Geodermatophilus sp. SYSU D01106]